MAIAGLAIAGFGLRDDFARVVHAHVLHERQFEVQARTNAGSLDPAETRELRALEQVIPSLAEWNAYTMQPVSEREKRWAYLFEKHIDAMKRPAG